MMLSRDDLKTVEGSDNYTDSGEDMDLNRNENKNANEFEMNEIREYYLKDYGKTDQADQRRSRTTNHVIAQRNSVNP